MTQRVGRRRRAAAGAGLGVDVGDMMLDGPQAQDQLGRDLAVGAAAGEQA